jgi:hypothetical protein
MTIGDKLIATGAAGTPTDDTIGGRGGKRFRISSGSGGVPREIQVSDIAVEAFVGAHVRGVAAIVCQNRDDRATGEVADNAKWKTLLGVCGHGNAARSKAMNGRAGKRRNWTRSIRFCARVGGKTREKQRRNERKWF